MLELDSSLNRSFTNSLARLEHEGFAQQRLRVGSSCLTRCPSLKVGVRSLVGENFRPSLAEAARESAVVLVQLAIGSLLTVFLLLLLQCSALGLSNGRSSGRRHSRRPGCRRSRDRRVVVSGGWRRELG